MGEKYEFKEDDLQANDYRAYYDSKVLRVWHLDGKEKTLTIKKVTRVTLESRDGVKKQPLVYFERITMPLALNKTNGEAIAHLYGRDPKAWIGKRVTLYPTTTQVGRNQVDCIRIRERSADEAPAQSE